MDTSILRVKALNSVSIDLSKQTRLHCRIAYTARSSSFSGRFDTPRFSSGLLSDRRSIEMTGSNLSLCWRCRRIFRRCSILSAVAALTIYSKQFLHCRVVLKYFLACITNIFACKVEIIVNLYALFG